LEKGQWTFLSNHGRVFLYITKNPKSTTEAISREVGLTQRGVQKIIAELEATGYIARRKSGRCNLYTVHHELPMRHKLERDHAVGSLLLALGCKLNDQPQVKEQENKLPLMAKRRQYYIW
jgi:predicted ArsR family transcriptional regulator